MPRKSEPHGNIRISIIIPFYSEEENVEAVLQETRGTNLHAEIIAGERRKQRFYGVEDSVTSLLVNENISWCRQPKSESLIADWNSDYLTKQFDQVRRN